MRGRTRHRNLLAGGILAASLLGVGAAAPVAAAADGPSADDPVATVNALLDALVAKDFASVGDYVCAEERDEAVAQFDLAAQISAELGGLDAQVLLDGMTISTPDRAVTEVSNDGSTAVVSITGSIHIDVAEEAAREFVRQVLEAMDETVTDEMLDEYTPLFMASVETAQDLTDPSVEVVLEDGLWLVCDELGGEEPPSPGPSVEPGASAEPMDSAAYEALLAAIPEGLRASCAPDPYWEVPDLGPEPGETAQADCDPDGYGGNWVSYSLFESNAAMDAFYDTQLAGMRNLGGLDGPGCPEGPGEATWESGRRFCYQAFGDDANMRWTHDGLMIAASAINDEGDWAALEGFFESAGPAAP